MIHNTSSLTPNSLSPTFGLSTSMAIAPIGSRKDYLPIEWMLIYFAILILLLFQTLCAKIRILEKNFFSPTLMKWKNWAHLII